MPAAPATKPKALTPEQEAVRRAQASYDSGAADYSGDLLASGSIHDAIARAISASDPTLDQLRASKADIQKRLGTVYADSLDSLSGVTDPRIREAIRSRQSAELGSEAERLGGLVSDRKGSQDQTADTFANVFNAQLGSKQFNLQQRQTALDRATQTEQTAEQRAFDSRMDDLTRREKEASIAATNRSNRGSSSGLTLPDVVKSPLLGFLAAGGQRIQDKSGGYQFFGPDGKPITVEDAAALVPGATKADLLSGSTNSQDQRTLQDAASSGKVPSAAILAQRTSAASGIQSVDQIQQLLDKGLSKAAIGSSKHGFTAFLSGGGAQQYRNASRNAADVLARLRTGAQINDSELALYQSFVPGVSDTPESARQKLSTLKFIFGSLSQGSNPTVADLGNVDTGV